MTKSLNNRILRTKDTIDIIHDTFDTLSSETYFGFNMRMELRKLYDTDLETFTKLVSFIDTCTRKRTPKTKITL